MKQGLSKVETMLERARLVGRGNGGGFKPETSLSPFYRVLMDFEGAQEVYNLLPLCHLAHAKGAGGVFNLNPFFIFQKLSTSGSGKLKPPFTSQKVQGGFRT